MNSRRKHQKINYLLRNQGNICKLCNKPINVALSPEHFMSVTLDHKLPRSFEGSNNIKNLQLAHKKCNLARGTKESFNGKRIF